MKVRLNVKQNMITYIRVVFLVIAAMTLDCAMREHYDQTKNLEESWKQYGDAAKKAIINQQYALAEEKHLRAINEIIKKYPINEEMRSNPIEYYTAWHYESISKIYVAQGRYEESEVAELTYYKLFKDNWRPFELPADYYRIIGEIYQLHGRYDEALNYFNDALNGEGPASGRIGSINPYVGRFYIETADYEKARQYLTEHLDFCINIHSISKNIATAKNNLALAYYYSNDDKEAEPLFREAAGLNANAMVGFPEDLAISLTMLGRIAEHRGDNYNALKYYQDAINVLERGKVRDFPGIYRVEQSNVRNQIGRFQLGQGNPDEASKAYHEAVALRQATATATHPNCADAIKGLADVAAFRGEFTSATLQAEQALKILDASVVPTHPRTAQELVALSSIYILAGHPEQAAPLEVRLETILQKPLGPWKEDFMETAAFYARLLKKVGKTADAEQLEQLQVRQKEKR